MWVGLLCTIGTDLTAPHVLPENGVCNHLIYDSVYKKGRAPFDSLIYENSSLDIFLDGGSQMNKTVLGIAYAYRQVIVAQFVIGILSSMN
ncbi:hypothetical protein MRX96_014846 [Rhipicephalus microplus]